MKKITIVAASALLAVALLGCSSKTQPIDSVATPTPVKEAPVTTQPVAKPATQTAKVAPTPAMTPQLVTIKSFSFRPANLTIKKGTSVKWVNNDGVPHSVTSDTFKSGVLNEGNFFQYTFTTPGTYSYGCSFHSDMKGSIVVTQ